MQVHPAALPLDLIDRDRHAAALLDPNGGVRATLEVPSDRAGHARLLQLAQVQAGGSGPWKERAAMGPG